MIARSSRTRLGRSVAAGGAALGIALAAPATSAQAARSAPQAVGGLSSVTRAPMLPFGARVVGPVSSTSRVDGAIALRLPDPTAVTAFIDDVSNPRSASFHHYLARGQFAARFGPSTAEVATVRSALVTAGLSVTSVSSNHLLVSFSGPASTVEQAFHTGLVRVRLASGSIGQATTSAVRLPANVARDVAAVVGLDQLTHETAAPVVFRGHGRPTPASALPHSSTGPVACAGALSQQVNGALTDQQVASSYGLDPLYGAGDLGAGQTIDVYELEPFLTSDIAAFNECFFGASHSSQLTVTTIDGGPGTGPGSGEAALDVEDVSAIAPGADVHVFSGPNMDDPFGPLDTWNAIAVADDASQITSSWGECETELQEGAPGVQQVEDEIFEQTAAQGQSVFSAAGDDGSDDCAAHDATPVAADLSVDDPASQPYVTSVGGTTILNATEPPVETVWNNGSDGGAGGGGISETWAMTPWQSAVAVPQTIADQACSNDPDGMPDLFHVAGVATNLSSGTLCREVPDVSALADPQSGITIYYAGAWYQIGGTSSATPLWASMLAEINASSSCDGLAHGVGFVDPLLYQIAAGSESDYADAFNDITVGNNDNLGVGGAIDWPAGVGYDLASGIGTPRVTDANGSPGLAAQLCTLALGDETIPPPSVTALSKDYGTVDGGNNITISGSNFGATQGTVWFGDTEANVNTWTASSISVQVPAYSPPQNSQSGTVAGPANVIVTTAGPPQESSAPNASALYHYGVVSAGNAKPVVDYVSSSTGPEAGGNDVDIVGTGFAGATSVLFGDQSASIVSILSDDELEVEVPPSDGDCAVSASQGLCAVAVSVTSPAGTSPTDTIQPAYQGPIVFSPDGSFQPPAGCGCEVVPAADEYDYAPAPTIASVSPTYASEDGTSSLTINGTGFNLLDLEWLNVGMSGVNFNEDYSVEGVTPTQVTFAIPPAQPTTEPDSTALSVQSSGGLSNVSSFSYAGTPVLTSLSTHLVAQASPGVLTVTGQGLSDVSSVVFQLQPPLNFLSSTSTEISNQTDTSLSVQIPNNFTFPTDVLLCSVTGCTSPNPAIDTLVIAYPGQPIVTSATPTTGPAHGQTTVTISGALDSEVTAVDFGSIPATIVTQPELAPSGPITVVAPAGVVGRTVPITITTEGGVLVGQPRSATTAAADFTFTRSSPSAPTDFTAKPGRGTATLRWHAPADTGGSAITGYVVVARATGQRTVSAHEATSARTAVLKLRGGVAWTITLRAVNALGDGLTASVTVTPAKT